MSSFKSNIKNRIMKMYLKKMLKNEKQFSHGTKTLKYVFDQKAKSDKLLVVFSAFPPHGKNASYNYVLRFNDMKCNKLYILDDFGTDNRGSYYLGNRDLSIANAVTELITHIGSKYDITNKNIITLGSSKGGFAALYFSLLNNYGACISGEPQIYLGDYLKKSSRQSIYNYIIGDVTEENTLTLNTKLFDLLNNNLDTKIYFHCGKNGDHYSEHLAPFIPYLDENSIEYHLDLGNYSDHREVGKHFIPFARKSILKKLLI